MECVSCVVDSGVGGLLKASLDVTTGWSDNAGNFLLQSKIERANMRLTYLMLMLLTAVLSCPNTNGQTAQKEGSSVGPETNDDTKPEYVRIRRSERRSAVALETSIIRFGDSKRYPDRTVDLIGAIHLGERTYYEELNQRFRNYDVLLFEAVMPKEAVRRGFRPGGGQGSGRRLNDEQEWTEAKIGLQAIGILQLGMKDALGLEFQLAAIDYTPGNFVHADMTQEDFEATMARRGESFSKLLMQEMSKAAIKQQNVNPVAQQLDLFISLMSSDRKYGVRRIAAVELTKANEGDAFAGSDGTSTIITERNKAALQILKTQLQRGKKKIGIFYGAGHFPDMEERVVSEFGFKRQSEEWLTAWNLKAPSKPQRTDQN